MEQQAVNAEQHAFQPKAIWAVCFILVFSVMNVTMFNVAIPSIAEQFGLLHSEVSWVTTGYAIIYAVGSLTYGKLADRFPLKRLIVIGIVTFCIGSLVGFFAHSYAMLLAGRFIQSMGASAIPALAMLIPARFVPQAERGKALGTIASTIAFASGVGPIVGGLITGAVSWNYLFLISLGTLLTVPLFMRWLPTERTRAGSFDFAGALLLAGGVVTLLLTITNFVWWLPLASAAFFAAFFAWIRKKQAPFIEPRLFRVKGVLTSLTIVFLSGTAAFGVMIVVPTLLDDVNGLSAIYIGFTLFPAAMAAALLGRQGGKLADRRGNGFVVGLAQSSILAGLLLLSSCGLVRRREPRVRQRRLLLHAGVDHEPRLDAASAGDDRDRDGHFYADQFLVRLRQRGGDDEGARRNDGPSAGQPAGASCRFGVQQRVPGHGVRHARHAVARQPDVPCARRRETGGRTAVNAACWRQFHAGMHRLARRRIRWH